MNKNTKIWLNYAIGGTISALLIWAIYAQTRSQLARFDKHTFFNTGTISLLIGALALMPVNLALESWKWKLLAGSAQPLSFIAAAKSFLAGLAISLITPNRIGEYPGRLLYLKRRNTARLISVTFLGMFTQFFTLFIYGIAGLIYYNIAFPGYWQKIVLVASVLVTIFIGLIFFKFEYIDQWFERLPWMRKFSTYSQLMRRFTLKEQLNILAISIVRFSVFTAQYLILLWWMNVQVPVGTGFLTGALFFWAMAVIPSIALAELGIRGQVSLFLFHPYSENQIGILAATLVLWFINLVIPALIGSLLLIRMRILK